MAYKHAKQERPHKFAGVYGFCQIFRFLVFFSDYDLQQVYQFLLTGEGTQMDAKMKNDCTW